MRRQETLRKLYSLKGAVNGTEMSRFHADFFSIGITTAVVVSGAVTTGITVSGATTTGLLLSGTATDGISITGVCADGIHISGAMTSSALHISGDQVIGILYDVTAAATDGLKIAVPTGITLTRGIYMTCTTTGTITTAISLDYTNSATEGIAMTVATAKTLTTGMSMSGAGTITTGILLDATAIGTGISITGACTTGISITGVCSGAGIDFGSAVVTTGSLIDYTGIVGKVSGYLFNGSMTTSVLTASTLVDDFGCSCAHDGVAADTIRAFRRTWTGALPNGTAAADFVIAEFVFSGTAGTDASKTGAVTGVKIDLGSATLNDSSLTAHGLYIDVSATATKAAAVYGISIDGGTTAINIVDASDLTNLLKFNEAAGCILNVDVDPADTPSDGGLGADACIVIDIAGSDYYIPIFAVSLS